MHRTFQLTAIFSLVAISISAGSLVDPAPSAAVEAGGLDSPPYTKLWPPDGLEPVGDLSRSIEEWEGELDEWTARTVEEKKNFEAWTHTVALQLALDRPGSALRTLARAKDADEWSPNQNAQLDWLGAAAHLAQEPHEEDVLEAEAELHAAERRLARLPQRGGWDLRRLYARAWLQCEWGESRPAAEFLGEHPELESGVRLNLYEAVFRASSQAGLSAWGPHFEDALAEGDTLRLRAAASIGVEPYLRWLLENMGPEIEAGLEKGEGGVAIDFSRVEDTIGIVAWEDDSIYEGIRARMDSMRELSASDAIETLDLVRAEAEFNRLFVDVSLDHDSRLEAAIAFAKPRLERCRDLGLWYEACRLSWGMRHAYAALGRADESLETARQNLDYARELGDPYYRATAAFNLFTTFADRGYMAERLRVLPEFLGLSERYRVLIPQALATHARVADNLGDLEESFELMSAAYRVARRHGDFYTRFANLEYLTHLALRLGELETVGAYVRACYELYDGYDRRDFDASYQAVFDDYHRYAILYDALSRPVDSTHRVRLLEDLLARAEGEGAANQSVVARIALAEAAIATGDPERAEQMIAAARVLAEDSRLPYNAWRVEAMDARRVAALGDPGPAIAAYESVIDRVEELGSQLNDSRAQAGYLVPERGVYDEYIRFLLDQDGQAPAAYAVDERGRARALRPKLGDLSAASGDGNVEGVQASLQPGQLLLQFRVLDDSVIRWALTHDTITVATLPVSRDEVDESVGQWLGDIAVGIRGDGAAELGALLTADLEPTIATYDELIFVADAPLASLPVALLEVEGRRLFESHVTRFEVSGAARVALAQRGDGRVEGSVLALAYDGRVAPDHLVLPVLPSVELEVRQLESIWDRAVVLSGQAAVPAALAAALPGPELVHLAAHAGLDRFGEPFILLAPDERGPGLLGRREIMDLSLQGVDLVTLAGCETSRLGTDRIHGDPTGLVGAVFAGGSRGLIASLWKVDDLSTLEFMRAFYEELLGAGRSPAQALRLAQLEMARDARYLERDWGAFCAYGP